MTEPRLRRRRHRDMVLPGTRSSSKAICFRARAKAAEGLRGQAKARGNSFRFVLSREEFVNCSSKTSNCLDLAKQLAEAESEAHSPATHFGSPANISVSRTVRLAMARRVARGGLEKHRGEGGARRLQRRATRGTAAELAVLPPRRSRSSIRSTSATVVSKRCEAGRPGGDVLLMDVSGSSEHKVLRSDSTCCFTCS